MIDIAREEAKKSGVDIQFFVEDCTLMKTYGEFGIILILILLFLFIFY